MIRLVLPAVAALAVVCIFTGCDNPQRTVDTLRSDIAEYRQSPGPELQEKINQGFAEVDSAIAKARERGDTLQAQSLQDQRDKLREAYAAARLGKAVDDAKSAIEGFGEALRGAGEDAVNAVRQVVPQAQPTPEDTDE